MGKIGFEIHGFLKDGLCVLDSVELMQCFAQAIIRGVIVFCHLHRMNEKGQAILPVSYLNRSENQAKGEGSAANHDANFSFS